MVKQGYRSGFGAWRDHDIGALGILIRRRS